ncbi:hypothetical protein GQ53DRAFT_238108 [Thozetella sp. PMI_491]|nr:hypothetical protein GQ53DRAFT_238108 [Thozetella sp. PMI_491]
MTPTVSSRRRACPACVKSKVRCQGTDGGICDRCARLSLPCSLPNSHGSPGATSHQPQRKDRIDRIQEQLDAIVAQLAETRGARPVSPPHTSATPDEVEVASSEAPTGDIFQRGVIDEDDGERLIQKFRSHKMPLFPFVVIAQEETLASLRKNSPFLLVAIAGVCLEDRPKLQRLFDAEVRNEVAKRVIVQGERNMDILLGLLVHLAWHQYHWEHFPSQMFMYLQMVGCLLGDMGLDGEVAYTMPAGYPSVSRLDKTVLPARHQRTAAGMRAVLGCYYLCSINSIFRKNIAMKLTPQLREYCNHLYAHPEHPTDTLLGAFVDSQSLSRGIEEMVLQRKALVWDSLSTTIEDACTKIKTKFTKHGLYTHGM